MNKLLIVPLFLLFPAAGYCGGSSFGELAAVQASPRANAMADAYTAADGDTLGFYYNPAQSAVRSVAAAYQRGYGEKDGTGIFAASLPGLLPKGLNLSLGFAYYNAGDIAMYGSNGDRFNFSAGKDWLLSANVSRQVYKNISAGITAKAAHIALFDKVSGYSMLFDAGVLAKYPLADLGFAVQNVGQSMRLGDRDEYFPSMWRAGAYRSFALKANTVNAALDYAKYKDEDGYLRLGGEFVYNKALALRLGYEVKNGLATQNTLVYGMGLMFNEWTFDYALVPFESLGTTHRFSLTYKFGKAGKKPEPAPVVAEAPTPVPPADTDGDGVIDPLDKCPGTPAGTKVEADGCPPAPVVEKQAIDRLADVAAPGSVTPVLVDSVRDAAGDPACPWEQKDKLCMKLGTKFDYDKSDIKPEFMPQLKEIAAFMTANPPAILELRGCTDDRGADTYNMKLSEARANAVKTYFINETGLAAERLSAVGLGKASPVASNLTDEGRQANRRVIVVLSMEGAK